MKRLDLIDFKAITLPKYNNFYLIAFPEKTNLKPQQLSPIFAMPIEKLIKNFETIIKKSHNIKLHNQSADGLQRIYIQRSRIFRFPDIIAVEFIKLSNTTSSIMLFSRAKYGILDFGVNRRRLRSWTKALLKHAC